MSTKAIAAISGIIGFAIGCAAMMLVLTERHRAAETKTSTSGATTAKVPATTARMWTKTTDSATAQDAQNQATFDDAAARHALNEILRRRISDYVSISYFGQGAKLTPAFLELFGVTPSEASQLNQILQSAKASMLNDLRSQAQVSRTEDGDIVVRFSPIDSGPDIYDKVMGGFQTVLGNDRFKDMMTFDKFHQIESQFNQFGAKVWAIRLHKKGTNDDGEAIYDYKYEVKNGWTGSDGTLKDLKQQFPELDGVISDE